MNGEYTRLVHLMFFKMLSKIYSLPNLINSKREEDDIEEIIDLEKMNRKGGGIFSLCCGERKKEKKVNVKILETQNDSNDNIQEEDYNDVDEDVNEAQKIMVNKKGEEEITFVDKKNHKESEIETEEEEIETDDGKEKKTCIVF